MSHSEGILCCGVRLIEPQGASHSNNFAHLTLPRKEDLIAPQLQIVIHPPDLNLHYK